MTATPNGTVVLAYSAAALDAAADPADVTEAVKVIYDTVIASLDWGSGFLDHEEEHLIYDLGKALGFEPPESMACWSWNWDEDGLPRQVKKCRFEGIDDHE